jgi:deoxyhypusine synthase
VDVSQFRRPYRPGGSVRDWLASLPAILAADDLRAVASAIRAAHARPAPVVWGLGGHVIKTGLAPVLADLMDRGFVSALALNGAALIHDFEIAIGGRTSEDVDAALGPGNFGMAEETATWLNDAIRAGVAAGRGLGESVVGFLRDSGRAAHPDASLLCAAGRHGVPVTVHVAIGTDIVHMHKAASGAMIGEGSLRDFRYFTSTVARLAGGVYLNCGSAVVLPEVFLKAVALARNRGIPLDGLTTVSLDFIRHYRPLTNVVHRPTQGVGTGYALVGHHELMIPLLAAAILG